MRGGFVGVDIFFVISGYLISGIIFTEVQTGKFSFIDFYMRRARRIFPALILMLCTAITFGWFVLFPPDFMMLGKHTAGGVAFISNFLFWQESGYFDANVIDKPLLHLWSLGVEEQFYIFWPLLVFIFIKFKRGLLALLVTVVFLSFISNIILSYIDSNTGFFLPFGRFWQLLTGAGIAYYEFTKTNKLNELGENTPKIFFGYEHLICVLGALLILSSLFLLSDKLVYPSFWAVVPTFGAAFIILSGQKAWFNRVVLSNSLLVFIGLISYPLYLWHWPLISFTHYIYDDRVPSVVRVFLIALSVALAWITYKFIEMPIRKQKSSSAVVIGVSTICFLTGLFGYVIYVKNGFEMRYETYLRQIVNFNGTEASKFMTDSKCFVPSASNTQLLKDCANTPSDPSLPTLMVLGDSYAGHLYAGLDARFSTQWNVRQITSSGCAPILNLKSRIQPTCPELNAQIFKILKDNPPKRVIISARWHLYDWKKIGSTLDYLRQIGVEQIYLVGPAPEWTQSLNRILYNVARKSSATTPISDHITLGLKPEIALLDDQIREFAQAYKVRYFAPRSVMCNENGCLAYVNGNSGALTAFDYGHLTKDGSLYLGSRFPD